MDCPIHETAQRFPDAIAVTSPEGSWTWREYDAQVTSSRMALSASGVLPGDQVAFHPAPTLATCVLLPALFRCGAVAMPINPLFPASYTAPLLQQARCSVWLDTDGEEPPPLPCGTRHIRLDMACTPAEEPGKLLDGQKSDRPVTIVFTSGSRGMPRAALHSMRNHRANAVHSNRNIPMVPGDRWLLSLPLFHVSGLGVLFRCWESGAAIALPAPGESLSQSIERAQVTHLSLVPLQLHRLLQEAEVVYSLGRLKAILLGGAAAPEALVRQAHAMGLPVCPTYGLTETASQATTVPPGASLEECLSSGRPLVPDMVRIAENGAIEVGGPTRFLGYVGPDGLDTPFRDGYFVTGDRGHFDARGCLHVEGRMDCMFVVGGENVQPERIEAQLMTLDGMEQAVVVPVPDVEYGAVPVAIVRSNGPLDEELWRAALAVSLPKYMIPHRFLSWPKQFADNLKPPRLALAEYARKQWAEAGTGSI